MKLKRFLATATSAAMAVTLLSGCSSSGPADGEITVNLGSEPSKLNSVLATGSVDGNVLRHIMLGLVELDENDEAQPGVAESWSHSDDKLTYTFKIREGMKWSNDEPVTAHDFEYAFDQQFYALNGASYAATWAALFEGANEMLAPEGIPQPPEGATVDEKTAFFGSDEYIDAYNTAFEAASATKGYKAVDDYTLEIKLTGPYDYFVGLLAYQSFYPVNEKAVEAMKGKNSIEKLTNYATDADKIVTNGPFDMETWAHESEIVLVKNDDFYDAENTKLEKITMKMITDTNTAYNDFKAGTIDMIGITPEQVDLLAKDGVETDMYNDGSTWYLEYNVNNPGLNNKKVRQALTMAADAQTLVDAIVKNDTTVASSFTPPAILAGEFQSEVGELLDISRDFDKAKALLEEGLAEEGMTIADLKITILGDEGENTKKTYEAVQAGFKENLGLEIGIEQVTYKARLARMDNMEFDIVFAGWGPDYNDPMTFLDLWVTGGGNNHMKWSNADYDAAIAAAYKEADTAKRNEYLITAEKILAEECPVGTLYWRTKDYVTSDRLEGVYRTAFQDMDFTEAYTK